MHAAYRQLTRPDGTPVMSLRRQLLVFAVFRCIAPWALLGLILSMVSVAMEGSVPQDRPPVSHCAAAPAEDGPRDDRGRMAPAGGGPANDKARADACEPEVPIVLL